MFWYKRHIGDFTQDTLHLSVTAIGCYDLLLDWYYANERPLPTDKADIYRLARASQRTEKQAVDKVLSEFFERQDDGWHNARADRELIEYGVRRDAKRENGKKGGRPRKPIDPEPNENLLGFDSVTEPDPNKKHNQTTKQLHADTTSTHAAASRARDDSAPISAPTPTAAGLACRLMKQAGCIGVNPQHPDLLAALDAGVTPEALADTAREAIELGKTKPFPWAIATARGRVDEANNHPPGAPHGNRTTGVRKLSVVERVERNAKAALERIEQLEQRESVDLLLGPDVADFR